MPTIAFESNLLAILTSFVWLIVLAWLMSIVLTLYGLSRQNPLLPTNHLRMTASDAPLVSVLVPARNEQHRVLADCIRSILAQDYGLFEVIAVNDRSTDATGAILETLAKSDDRLRVIEGQEPPAGWLGKPYAMQRAFNHARGEWILATDADMIFDRAALRTAVDRTLEGNGDAMTLIPHFEASSFWECVMIPTWSWVLLMFTLFYRISNPKTQGAVGIGGFFLMRRTVLERVGGYEGLKDEVMEDVRLAEMIKRSGARLFTEYAPNLLSTRMYRNFGEMWECSTKNWFSGDEVLTALCIVVRLFDVFDVCRATTHCPGICDWDCSRSEPTPLAIVHSRRLVMVAASSCPCDGQHMFRSFSRLCVDCATRFEFALRHVV